MRKIIAAVAAAAILATAVGCTWFKSEAKTAEATAIACAQQDLGVSVGSGSAQAPSLLDQVLGIVLAGGASWEADLAALAVKFGGDAIACAVQVAEQLFRDGGSAAGSALATAATAQSPHDRAVIALQKYTGGRKFK